MEGLETELGVKQTSPLLNKEVTALLVMGSDRSTRRIMQLASFSISEMENNQERREEIICKVEQKKAKGN